MNGSSIFFHHGFSLIPKPQDFPYLLTKVLGDSTPILWKIFPRTHVGSHGTNFVYLPTNSSPEKINQIYAGKSIIIWIHNWEMKKDTSIQSIQSPFYGKYMGVSLNGGFPPISQPKCWSFLIGKPHGFAGETHHFRVHPHVSVPWIRHGSADFAGHSTDQHWPTPPKHCELQTHRAVREDPTPGDQAIGRIDFWVHKNCLGFERTKDSTEQNSRWK